MQTQPCQSCTRPAHDTICRRCKIKKHRYLVPTATRARIIELKTSGTGSAEVARITGVNVNTVKTVWRKEVKVESEFFRW